MPYIFGKLWHLAIILDLRKAFKCILQGVRFLLANHTRLSPASENDSYTDDDDGNLISILCHLPKDQEACTYSPAWFYDPAKGDCTRLIYGKCPGDNKNQFKSERECRHACGWAPGSHVPKEEKGNDYWFAKTVKYWDDFRPKPKPKPKSKGQLGYEHYMMW